MTSFLCISEQQKEQNLTLGFPGQQGKRKEQNGPNENRKHGNGKFLPSEPYKGVNKSFVTPEENTCKQLRSCK